MGYLGEESLYPIPSIPRYVDDTIAETTEFCEKLLEGTNVTEIPPPMLVSAMADNYFDHVYPLEPVIDRGDLLRHGSSPLLVLAVCMSGTSFGHLRGSTKQIMASNKYYLRVKTLVNIDYEKNNVIVLKALCMLSCRGAKLPTQINMDSAWHWLGVSVRYAIHMGLHKEATYHGKDTAGTCRRMWWHLFVRYHSIPRRLLPPT